MKFRSICFPTEISNLFSLKSQTTTSRVNIKKRKFHRLHKFLLLQLSKGLNSLKTSLKKEFSHREKFLWRKMHQLRLAFRCLKLRVLVTETETVLTKGKYKETLGSELKSRQDIILSIKRKPTANRLSSSKSAFVQINISSISIHPIKTIETSNNNCSPT